MRKLSLLVFTVLLVLSGAVPASAGGSEVLYPPDASPGGMSYPEWLGAYQVWLNEIPSPKNPIFDPATSRNCELQTGGVVFLGAAGADCSVPEGAPLVFTGALSFWECSTAEGLGETYKELRRCARVNFGRDLDPAIFHQRIVLDGVRLAHQRRWVFLSPGEIIDFPEDNIWGAVPGPSKSVTKGFLFAMQPPSIGTHTIRLRLVADEIGTFHFVWRLHVEAGYPSS